MTINDLSISALEAAGQKTPGRQQALPGRGVESVRACR
jgi:hypothetical protein